MSTKTYFKRISLAVILALGFGALSSAPSQALLANSAAVTVSAATDSKIATETSTVTITASFTSTVAGETFVVRVIGTGGTGGQDSVVTRISTSDSLNITSGTSFVNVPANTGVVLTATAADVLTRVKVILDIRKVNVVGTHTYNANLYSSTAGAAVSLVAQTQYTLTVTAANTDATAAQSLLWLNGTLTGSGATYIQADSSLVVSANQQPDLSLMTPAKVAYLAPNFRNSAGESIVATTGTNVDGTMTVKITSGPGLLSKNSTDGTKARQFDIARGESLTIWNDGASGVTTITSYIGTTPLAQSAKTITFYGKATTFTVTANAVTKGGGNLSYSDTGVSGNDILSFIATDATGLAVPTASQNRASAFYMNISDTTVFRAIGSATSNRVTCDISATATEAAAGKWYCDGYVIDSGTVTLTVMDSETVGTSTYTGTPVVVTVAGTAVAGTICFTKIGTDCVPSTTPATQTFEPGESVLMKLTAKDGLGRNAGQTVAQWNAGGAAHNPFNWSIPAGNLGQDKPFWIGSSINYSGGITTGATTFSTVDQFLTSSSTFLNGVETVVVYMPTTSGDINIKGATGTTKAATADTNTPVTATLKVTGGAAQAAADAAAAAANAASAAAVAAAKAGQDAAVAAAAAAQAEAQAATDAAAEAIDAAKAATDAANLAAEAADAATVAAEEARDAADAATAAVEELATQVASLMAALRAQITTLANTVVKIAKKVKA